VSSTGRGRLCGTMQGGGDRGYPRRPLGIGALSVWGCTDVRGDALLCERDPDGQKSSLREKKTVRKRDLELDPVPVALGLRGVGKECGNQTGSRDVGEEWQDGGHTGGLCTASPKRSSSVAPQTGGGHEADR